MKEGLLLPYANDFEGNLVYIDNAQRGQNYTCPICGTSLLLKIGKIPEGQKYHRRNHFAHKGNSDHHCSESFLHKLFKEKCAEFICNKISKQEKLIFQWKCKKCSKQHDFDLLGKVVRVVVEYDLGLRKPRPDIALLDNNNNIICVIEVVVTHKPSPDVLRYYEDNKIVCLQVKVSDFSCCDTIEDKLSNVYTDSTFMCVYRQPQFVRNQPCNYDYDNILFDFLNKNGNKMCKKCGGKLLIDTEEGLWKRPILKCEKSGCDYIETLSDYEHLIFPDMK